MSSIPFNLQYYVEKDRNDLFQWLLFVLGIIVLILHGIVFYWLPKLARARRLSDLLKFKWLFIFFKGWDKMNNVIMFRLPFRTLSFQPSLLFLFFAYIGINVAFAFSKTKDIDYQERYYIIAKRIGKLGIGNFLLLMLVLIKHNLFHSIIGLPNEILIIFHKWISRVAFALITIHVGLSIRYWLSLDFKVMLVIPPQIFGIIAYSSFFLIVLSSVKFLRNFAFDFFLIQHKVLSGIMLLFALFHSPPARAGVIIAVHILVADKVIERILTFYKYFSGTTRGESAFTILDEQTVKVVIPSGEAKARNRVGEYLYQNLVKSWVPGQHIYLNVGKVSRFQFHPFTIASLPSSGEMVLLIRVKRGFTKQLLKKLRKMDESIDTITSNCHHLKVKFAGPYGGIHQPLNTFDTVVCLSTGLGSSFTLPIALDLLQNLEGTSKSSKVHNNATNLRIHIICVMKTYRDFFYYDHIIKQFGPFLKEGKVQFDVYLTQSEIKIRSSSSSSSECQIKLKRKEESFTEDYYSETSSNNFPTNYLPHICFYPGRPLLDLIIKEDIEGVSFTAEQLKSVGVFSCGHENFTQEIRVICQKYRKFKSSPDLYYYSEAF